MPGLYPVSEEHGDSSYKKAEQLGLDPSSILNLAVNLNPFAPDLKEKAREALERGVLSMYPREDQAKEALAKEIGIDEERLVLTNGASEAIAILARHLKRGCVKKPEFSLYERHLSVVEDSAPLWRSNPHNPTGALASPDEQAAVWDESFYPHSVGSWSRGVAEGAWVIGSLTKVLSVPGLRIGYLVAPDEGGAREVESLKPLWSVNSLALALVPQALLELDLKEQARLIREAREETRRVFESYGIHCLESEAPFFLLKLDKRTAQELEKKGVFLRDCRNMGLEGYFRSRVASETELEVLERALRSL